MLIWFLSATLAWYSSYKLASRWHSKLRAILAAFVGIFTAGVFSLCAAALSIWIAPEQIRLSEALIGSFVGIYISIFIAPLAAWRGWLSVNHSHKIRVTNCPQCGQSVSRKEPNCNNCGFDLAKGGAR